MPRSSMLVLAAFVALAPARLAAQTETETVGRTLTVQAGTSLRLKTFSGRVTITTGGAGQMVIHAVRRATRDRLDRVQLDIQQRDHEVLVNSNHRLNERRDDSVVETDFDIQVPADMPLELQTFSARVEITGSTGRIAIEGFSGDIRLTDVAGPARVKTFSGNVDLGATRWTDGHDVDLQTFSGSVIVQLPDSARGDIEFDTFSGSFTSALPVTMQASSRRNFRGQLNGGGGTDFRLKTFSGPVSITAR